MGHSAFVSTFPIAHIARTPDTGDGYVSFLTIPQASHGFLQDNIVYYSGAPYAKAQADVEATIGWGAVGKVIDANSFELVLEGIVNSPAHALGNPGDALYLDQGTAGAVTTSVPTSGIVQPIGLVLSTGQYYVHIMNAESI